MMQVQADGFAIKHALQSPDLSLTVGLQVLEVARLSRL